MLAFLQGPDFAEVWVVGSNCDNNNLLIIDAE